MIDIIFSIFLIALCEELWLPIGFHILAWGAAVCSVMKLIISCKTKPNDNINNVTNEISSYEEGGAL